MSEFRLNVSLPADVVETVARRAADLVLAGLGPVPWSGSPWLCGAQAAADYLGWPRERVYKALPRLPHYRERGRLMFRRDELDRYVMGLRR